MVVKWVGATDFILPAYLGGGIGREIAFMFHFTAKRVVKKLFKKGDI